MKLLIVQARMGSTRLPGKVLKKIDGKPILLILLERVMRSKKIDKVVVATTKNRIDKEIVNFCDNYGFNHFRGSEQDVLNRYYNCAKHYNAKIIIRVTSDCPLIDPIVIDKTVRLFEKNDVEYAANTIPPESRRWPDGSDVEVFSYQGLCEANKNAIGLEREHVTFYFWKRKGLYRTLQLNNKYNWASYRYTLDYEEDFSNLNKIINIINKKKIFGYTEEVVEIIKNNFKNNKFKKKLSFGYGWKKDKI